MLSLSLFLLFTVILLVVFQRTNDEDAVAHHLLALKAEGFFDM